MLWVSLSEKNRPDSALPLFRTPPSIPASISWWNNHLMFCMLNKGQDDDRNALQILRCCIFLECAGFRGAEKYLNISTFGFLQIFCVKKRKKRQYSTVTLNPPVSTTVWHQPTKTNTAGSIILYCQAHMMIEMWFQRLICNRIKPKSGSIIGTSSQHYQGEKKKKRLLKSLVILICIQRFVCPDINLCSLSSLCFYSYMGKKKKPTKKSPHPLTSLKPSAPVTSPWVTQLQPGPAVVFAGQVRQAATSIPATPFPAQLLLAPPCASPPVQPSPLTKPGEAALPVDTPTPLLNAPSW